VTPAGLPEGVLTTDPSILAAMDYIRAAFSALALVTIAMYVRLGWLRWRRMRIGDPVARWPVLGTASLVLLLLVVAALGLQRRGMPLTWRGPVTWIAICLAMIEALRSLRINWTPPWRRHAPRKGNRRRR
jgi:predicted tellurium resistance membrane protein TerC